MMRGPIFGEHVSRVQDYRYPGHQAPAEPGQNHHRGLRSCDSCDRSMKASMSSRRNRTILPCLAAGSCPARIQRSMVFLLTLR